MRDVVTAITWTYKMLKIALPLRQWVAFRNTGETYLMDRQDEKAFAVPRIHLPVRESHSRL